jgi:hypothetical protein
VTEIAGHSLTPCRSGKSTYRNATLRTLPAGRQTAGAEPYRTCCSCSVARIPAQDLGTARRRPQSPASAKPCSNMRAASHAIPVAALCCCTPAPAVRIMSLTSGAKGTRTPDPLLANNRQHVHPRPSPQVTVPERVSASLQIRTCCGTSVLYSRPWPMAASRRAAAPRRTSVRPRKT